MSNSSITPWVVGNWKMNPMHANAFQLVEEFKQLLQQENIAAEQCHIGVAPTAIALSGIQTQFKDAARTIYTVAQDVSRVAGTGAYTGEVSAELLKDSGIEFVLIGHSERRELFGDNVEILKAKLQNALSAGLKIIYCVGESLEQREQGAAEQVVLQQICDIAAVVRAEQWQNIVIAYEPIWAIGTGKTASPADAQAMHAKIREGLKQITAFGANMAILYGGSVKAENAVELAACPDINGALVGGASLNAQSFYQIAKAFAQSK
ncbi:triosephosphate isomerase [Acinetobacter gyllenbergii]|uniref:Triosephosphate isomerase n=1 Tax=Acinetobacter gyllenbergii CIP 110306 = MTCC 11365 TaxID=1217657 RepID=A0A829HE98_9GAMM|nr:triose-phosphate isomerase [Acinetobacter gyllenbergii]EPF75507.1 triosephosphate isomerase [Acinetobacter gyllenbergii CIP 110306 = MTCC 11365]ESK39405.1 triosephosphate isomerase [Acinetobacter gyllenbergii NIPH 230]GMA10900.1 triosephosphate isomerase [Acinetobacter gyllenbergii]